MTRVINAAHAAHTRVVLTVSVFAWTTNKAAIAEGHPRQQHGRASNLARQIAAAVRDRGADGVNLDFEPLACGYEDEFMALVRTVRSELNRSARGYQLTFDTTGWIGNYPIERRSPPGAADAIFIMGYDYRTAGSNYRRLDRPAGRAGLRPRGHRQGLHRPRVAVPKLILGRAVLRPGLVDRVGERPRGKPRRVRSTASRPR